MVSFIKRYLLYVVLLFSVVSARSQTSERQITGKVLDSKTLEPLPFANVYVNNSTIGTSTNEKGEFTLSNIPFSNPDIIFSFLGYESYQTRLNLQIAGQNPLIIRLIPNLKELSEVEVKESRDKTWERQLRKFEKTFLGESELASESKIINPWVINFKNENNVLTAKADAPLEIENLGLGYKLFFQLKDFKYTGTSYSIIGNTRFQDLIAPDAKMAKEWMKNREEIYLGSLKHFASAVMNHTIKTEGFLLYTDKEKGKARSGYFSYELAHNLVPFDTTNLLTPDVQPNVFKILVKSRIEIHYIYGFAKSTFYKDVSHAVSWLEVKGNYLRVNKDGIILNPADVILSGDMSETRVAGMLPMDYKKGDIVHVRSHETVAVKRAQEKVYLHLDKPYYYAGESIWFSAYMNYRAKDVADTLSRVLYVDLLDNKNEVVKSLILKMDSGRTSGKIKITQIPPGNYILRAYTEWMKNYGSAHFFYKAIPVLDLRSKPDNEQSQPVTYDENIIVTFDKPDYNKRDKVKMVLALADQSLDGSASLSIAITNENQVISLADSSIFKEYAFPNDFSGLLPKLTYPVERGISFSGTYYDKKGKTEKVRLTFVQDGFENIYQLTTSDKGVFSKRDLSFYDSVKFAFQPPTGKVVLKSKTSVDLPSRMPVSALHVYKSDSIQRRFSYDTANTILLQTVEVKARKTEQQYENNYVTPDFYIKGDDMQGYSSVAAAISVKVPAYKLIHYGMHMYIIWGRGEFTRMDRAPSEPALYINGSLLVLGSEETAGDRLNELNPATIDHVEVNSMINSGLGANGANGMISVYSKRATPENFKALPTFKVRGFNKPARFQSPDYENGSSQKDKEDVRSTIYWNPRIDLTSKRKTIDLHFFTSDEGGKYRVVIEGVTNKGKPFRIEKQLLVNE